MRKCFVIILVLCLLFSLNICFAQEIDNSTDLVSSQNSSYLLKSDVAKLSTSDKIDTHIDVISNDTLDVKGDYFKIKLVDANNKSISNAKIIFTIKGVNYEKTTNSHGIALLKINMVDGSYQISSKFLGDSKYNPSSKSTIVTMNNTRVVESGLSNSEIQNIINNAKENNVIIFKGSSYSDINLIIDKRLTLISTASTVLQSSSNSPVITIKGKAASYSIVMGFKIQGSGDGIVVNDADYVRILNNHVTVDGIGITASNTKYLNITKNSIYKNGKCGIVFYSTENSYIIANVIINNGANGVVLTKSDTTYIDNNTISKNARYGILLTNEFNKKYYKTGPVNVHITKNTINGNSWDGVCIYNAGDNINIKGNTIDANKVSGVSINSVGTYKIQSNVITNSVSGVSFEEEYTQIKDQEISYNAIFGNSHVQVEAKSYAGVDRLSVGDNWYTDDGLLCPKIKTNNLKFTVTQIGKNQFQASFVDSNGQIASLLPDRVLTYKTSDGKTATVTIKGGVGTFTVSAADADIIKSTVDRTNRKNVYDSNTPSKTPQNGQSPTFSYPDINYGDGDGDGEGNGNGANQGNGTSQTSGDNTGNSSSAQNMEPNSNPVNDVSQAQDVGQIGASESSGGASGASQSVTKQIVIEDDEFFKVKGLIVIITLILLTLGLYYRKDIEEMRSKQ